MASDENNTTPHLRTGLRWSGLGSNDTYSESYNRSTSVERLSPYWQRIPLTIPDPGHNALTLDDPSRDALWTSYATRVACSGMLQGVNNQSIFYGTNVPRSWLGVSHELRGDSLMTYAKLLVSGVIAMRAVGLIVTWLELLEEPDISGNRHNGVTWLSRSIKIPLLTPDNYAILIRAFKSEMSRREVGAVKLLGPCLSRCISVAEYSEPYVAALARQPPLDGWSIHIIEDPSDSACYNAGTYGARTYVSRQMARTLMFMRWINADIPVFVTKFGTRATRFTTGINYGRGASNTVEHALRLVESLCNIVVTGARVVIPWNTTDIGVGNDETSDTHCLLRRDGAQRPHCDALTYVNVTLPVEGLVFHRAPGAWNVNDETLTLAVVNGNALGFILGRAHSNDSMDGGYVFKLTNADWAHDPNVGTSFEATVTLSAYPTYVSLTGANRKVTVDSTGTLVIVFKELPYNCIVFGRGDVYAI